MDEPSVFFREPDPPLFPEWVVQHTVRFDADLVTREEHPWLVLPPGIQRAVPKRKAEFVAGRFCARAAMRRLPVDSEAPVGIGAQREPTWPGSVVGAITHSAGRASSAVALADRARGIGLDFEPVMTHERASNVASHLASAAELERLAPHAEGDFGLAVTVIFSAKESIFKCLFPEVGRFFGFMDANVLAFDLAAGSFEAELVVTLTSELPAGLLLHGRVHLTEAGIFTGLVLPREERG